MQNERCRFESEVLGSPRSKWVGTSLPGIGLKKSAEGSATASQESGHQTRGSRWNMYPKHIHVHYARHTSTGTPRTFGLRLGSAARFALRFMVLIVECRSLRCVIANWKACFLLTQHWKNENYEIAPFSKPMRPSDFVLFTLKLTLFLDFYAKVLLISFKRRDLPNRKVYRAKSSNINS